MKTEQETKDMILEFEKTIEKNNKERRDIATSKERKTVLRFFNHESRISITLLKWVLE